MQTNGERRPSPLTVGLILSQSASYTKMSAAGAPIAQADAATANAAIARQALRAVGAGGRRDLSRVSVALTDLPTPEELISWYMATCELKLIIRERHAGGKAKTSGRYKKHDSARLHYIETVIIPDLKMGKTPNAYDAHIVYAQVAARVRLVQAAARGRERREGRE